MGNFTLTKDFQHLTFGSIYHLLLTGEAEMFLSKDGSTYKLNESNEMVWYFKGCETPHPCYNLAASAIVKPAKDLEGHIYSFQEALFHKQAHPDDIVYSSDCSTCTIYLHIWYKDEEKRDLDYAILYLTTDKSPNPSFCVARESKDYIIFEDCGNYKEHKKREKAFPMYCLTRFFNHKWAIKKGTSNE